MSHAQAELDDRKRGMYRKYFVRRLDDFAGKHKNCCYHVLDIDHDPHAIPALEAYADSAEADGFTELAADIRRIVKSRVDSTLP